MIENCDNALADYAVINRYDTQIAFPTVQYTKSYKLKSWFQWSEIELYHITTRLTDIRLEMFILHVKCNFDENFKDLQSYSNIFDERFFFLIPRPPAIFQPKRYTAGPSPGFKFNGDR